MGRSGWAKTNHFHLTHGIVKPRMQPEDRLFRDVGTKHSPGSNVESTQRGTIQMRNARFKSRPTRAHFSNGRPSSYLKICNYESSLSDGSWQVHRGESPEGGALAGTGDGSRSNPGSKESTAFGQVTATSRPTLCFNLLQRLA